jgi:hypothetical protein
MLIEQAIHGLSFGPKIFGIAAFSFPKFQFSVFGTQGLSTVRYVTSAQNKRFFP